MKYLALTRGYRAKVDDEDYRGLMRWKWHASVSRSKVYGARCWRDENGKQKKIMLHHEVLGGRPGKGLVVDHVNHDGLDCRKENLRVCTDQQNKWNSRAKRNKCSSRYKGVTWQRAKKPFKGGWQVTIMCRGERRYLGFFGREYEAVVAYNRAAARLFGGYGYINRWDGPTRESERAEQGYRATDAEKVRWVGIYNETQ